MSYLTRLNIVLKNLLVISVSFMMAVAPNYIDSGSSNFNFSTLLTSAYIAIALYIFMFLFKVISRYLNEKAARNIVVSLFDNVLNKKNAIVILTLIMLVCWIPVLIFLYPGNAINDTWGQFSQYIKMFDGGILHRGVLSDHHPFFDTLFMGGIIVPLAHLFHNWKLAFFCYVILQYVLTCLSFSVSVWYLHKKCSISINLTTVVYSIYCILPIFPVSAQTISKDALFSWIYVYLTILLIEVIRTNGSVLSSKKYLIVLILTIFFVGLTKKVGLYVVILTLVAFLIFLKSSRKYILILFAAIALLSFGLTGFIKSELKVIPGGKQEMFSLPFQQTARYMKYHSEDVTKDEKKVIGKLLDTKNISKNYIPISADPVKGFEDRGTTEDYVNYIKVWIKQGIKHPKTYISATVAMLSGWFSTEEYSPLMNMDWHNQLDTRIIPESISERKGLSSKLAKEYQKFYDNLYNNKVTGLIVSYALYATILPLIVCLALWNKYDRKWWLITIPMLLSIALGCWLAPVSIFLEGRRYLYPVIYTLPILLAISSSLITENSTLFIRGK